MILRRSFRMTLVLKVVPLISQLAFGAKTTCLLWLGKPLQNRCAPPASTITIMVRRQAQRRLAPRAFTWSTRRPLRPQGKPRAYMSALSLPGSSAEVTKRWWTLTLKKALHTVLSEGTVWRANRSTTSVRLLEAFRGCRVAAKCTQMQWFNSISLPLVCQLRSAPSTTNALWCRQAVLIWSVLRRLLMRRLSSCTWEVWETINRLETNLGAIIQTWTDLPT